MDIETWALIRHLRLSQRLTIAAIAHQLGLDRKTVRKALGTQDALGPTRRTRSSLLDPFQPTIQEILKEYPDLSAVRILEELRKKGYQGGITILRDYLTKVRPGATDAYLRLSMPAGRQAQVDWGHCGTIAVGSTTRPLYCFVMVLCYSRALHLEFTVSMTEEAFLESHVKAFRFFSGIPRELLYDNCRTVVLSRVGADARLQPRFVEFAGYYGFQPKLCSVARPREKGRVEMGVKYVKKNLLAGRSFRDLEELGRHALQWRDEVANVRIHGTTHRRPIDMLQEERPCLMPVPDNDYDTALRRTFVCPPDAFVVFQTNSYSVPTSCVGKPLLLKADTYVIRIYDATRLVAEHRRSYDRHQQIEDPSHRRGLLAQRPRARLSKAFEELCALGPECQRYLAGLNRCEIKLHLHVQRLLGLARIYGTAEFRQAVCRALCFDAFGADYIENIIVHNRRRRNAASPSGPVHLASRPELMALSVTPHALETYDRVREEANAEDPPDRNKGDC